MTFVYVFIAFLLGSGIGYYLAGAFTYSEEIVDRDKITNHTNVIGYRYTIRKTYNTGTVKYEVIDRYV